MLLSFLTWLYISFELLQIFFSYFYIALNIFSAEKIYKGDNLNKEWLLGVPFTSVLGIAYLGDGPGVGVGLLLFLTVNVVSAKPSLDTILSAWVPLEKDEDIVRVFVLEYH